MATAASNSQPNKILVVEDEWIIAEDVSECLQRLGYEVCAIASTGEEALEAAERHQPVIALMDIRLRGQMDGIEAAEQISERHGIPVIFLTAHMDQQTLDRAKHADPFGYLTKPLNERDLGVAVQIALYRNVAQRRIRQAEVALRASETRMRAIVETAVDAIVTVDGGGTVQSFNPSAERIFGYVAEEIIRRSIAVLMPKTIGRHDPESIRAYLESSSGTIVGSDREVEGRRRDGSTVPLELSIAAWTAEGVPHFTGIMRDITERKRLDDELRVRNAELARINARLDQFAHIVGHDLRAPMRALSNAAIWIVEDLGEAANETVRSHVRRIVEARERMSAMLDDLRSYSRAGLDSTAPEPVDLHEIVAAIEKYAPSGIAATITVAGPVYRFVVQRTAIEIVLRNLIENAIRHCDRDAVAISVHCEERDGQLMFEVADDGPGVPPCFHPYIFTPFAKVDPSSSRGGTGMGLTLVKRVIEDNGGTITLDSRPPERRGARFRFSWTLNRSAGSLVS
jgi:PAS domain S-box-containing protein